MRKILLFILLILTTQIKAQADCSSALSVCGNSTINYTPVGVGNVLESLGGCLTSGEHNSVWYKFTIATSGTLTFVIIPADPTVDYDWAVYGPNRTCGNLGSPIRCNAATAVGVGPNTGLNMTNTNTVGAPGSTVPFCRYMDVVAGETYYLYIDNWVNNINPAMSAFSLTWGGTATLVSPFTNPTVQPNPFVPPGAPSATPNGPREVVVCTDPATFNFSTLSAGILNSNPDFSITYHLTQNEALTSANPITGSLIVNLVDTYYYSIKYTDPTNANNPINSCRQIGTFKFILGNIKGVNVTLFGCNNNGNGVSTYDLTTAAVFGDPTATLKYYSTINDLNNGVNEILNTTTYTAAEGKVYVKITSRFGCEAIAEITLRFNPVVVVQEATLRTCFLEANPSTGEFDLSLANVSGQPNITKEYYPSVTDAINGTNSIVNFTNYVSPSGVAYVKVFNMQGCYAIAKVNLVVFAPVYSSVLKDKIICMENTTVLDAGPGFTDYMWSNGDLTQTTTVGVGTYWVKLKTGDCHTKQIVHVYSSEQPVVTEVEITSTTITVHVQGGTAPYQYSLDNITWQESNIFTNITRGDHIVYVKDSYNCEPIKVNVVVPNLVNVITPNGDGVNDVIDYSALANKQNLVFNVYDRYGVLIFKADQTNGYKWNGTNVGGRKLTTGNYWYSVSWNENNSKNTPIKYSGWIMLKNRD